MSSGPSPCWWCRGNGKVEEGAVISLKAFQGGAVFNSLLPEILELARREGILRLLKTLSPFSLDRLYVELESELGYALLGNRRRMIVVLLDLFAELGLCFREEVKWRWAANEKGERGPRKTAAGRTGERDPAVDDGQFLFFQECLRSVPAYLRGGSAVLGFDRKSVGAWDRFLGCAEFRLFRKVLLELMEVKNAPTFRLLDLCHGPGWGVAEAATLYPEIQITAIDFTEAFVQTAIDRMKSVAEKNRAVGYAGEDIVWVGPSQWSGFGSPLPFDDGSFDSVFFSGGDPYIPRELRKDVYGEIARVLAPWGRLGILTRGYPDSARRSVPSRGMRIAALVHDFAESVCEGWKGFSDPEEQQRMFMEIGYREGGVVFGSMNFLESSLWVLRKGEGVV